MLRSDRHDTGALTPPPQDFLAAENVSLRLLLAQAEIDAQKLLAQAGIDAKEREVSDKLQELILEELHHRIKNTLATVGAIASQSLRNAPSVEHAQQAIEGRRFVDQAPQSKRQILKESPDVQPQSHAAGAARQPESKRSR